MTDREIQLQREAYIAGRMAGFSSPALVDIRPALQHGAEVEAAERYPLPNEPAIVTDTRGAQWRYGAAKKLEVKWTSDGFWESYDYDERWNPTFVLAIAEIAREALESE